MRLHRVGRDAPKAKIYLKLEYTNPGGSVKDRPALQMMKDAIADGRLTIDAKGGAALSVAYTINKPLIFVGVGQDYPDLRPFDAAWMVDRLFGGEEAEATTAA